MKDKFIFIFFGVIIGTFLMFISSNIICLRGANSQDVRNTVVVKDNKLYKFEPIVHENNEKNIAVNKT